MDGTEAMTAAGIGVCVGVAVASPVRSVAVASHCCDEGIVVNDVVAALYVLPCASNTLVMTASTKHETKLGKKRSLYCMKPKSKNSKPLTSCLFTFWVSPFYHPFEKQGRDFAEMFEPLYIADRKHISFCQATLLQSK